MTPALCQLHYNILLQYVMNSTTIASMNGENGDQWAGIAHLDHGPQLVNPPPLGPERLSETQQLAKARLDLIRSLPESADILDIENTMGVYTGFPQTLDAELLTICNPAHLPRTDQAKMELGMGLIMRCGPAAKHVLPLANKRASWSNHDISNLTKPRREAYQEDYPLALDNERREMAFQRRMRQSINQTVGLLLHTAVNYPNGEQEIDTVTHAVLVQARLGVNNSYSRYVFGLVARRYGAPLVHETFSAAGRQIDIERSRLHLPRNLLLDNSNH